MQELGLKPVIEGEEMTRVIVDYTDLMTLTLQIGLQRIALQDSSIVVGTVKGEYTYLHTIECLMRDRIR